jgi:MFS family permease
MTKFPTKKIAKLNGLLYTFTGLGMLMGPIMGSFLYKIGGFRLPFYTVGVLLLFLAFVINCLVKNY